VLRPPLAPERYNRRAGGSSCKRHRLKPDPSSPSGDIRSSP
jgi:hypothetical protein